MRGKSPPYCDVKTMAGIYCARALVVNLYCNDNTDAEYCHFFLYQNMVERPPRIIGRLVINTHVQIITSILLLALWQHGGEALSCAPSFECTCVSRLAILLCRHGEMLYRKVINRTHMEDIHVHGEVY